MFMEILEYTQRLILPFLKWWPSEAINLSKIEN